MPNLFTAHPHSVGETYFQHFRYAMKNALIIVGAGLILMIHSILPFLFKKTAMSLLLSIVTKHIERIPAVDDRIVYLSDCIKLKKVEPTFHKTA